jgi:hypothetical protein
MAGDSTDDENVVNLSFFIPFQFLNALRKLEIIRQKKIGLEESTRKVRPFQEVTMMGTSL